MSGKHFLFDENKSAVEGMSKLEIENEISEAVGELGDEVNGKINEINNKLSGVYTIKRTAAQGTLDLTNNVITISDPPSIPDLTLLNKVYLSTPNTDFICQKFEPVILNSSTAPQLNQIELIDSEHDIYLSLSYDLSTIKPLGTSTLHAGWGDTIIFEYYVNAN